MDLLSIRPGMLGLRIPRTRGDGPDSDGAARDDVVDSPHARGWTLAISRRRSWSRGFPARAGMDPDRRARRVAQHGIPRTRGDGPSTLSPASSPDRDSPHARGWT